MTKKELFEKAIDVKFNELENVPILGGIYIVQQMKLHDSGFRMMYVFGHTSWDVEKDDMDVYLLGVCSDVVDFEGFFTHLKMEDLHLDINNHGIIHIWSSKNRFKCTHMLSNCVFEVVK